VGQDQNSRDDRSPAAEDKATAEPPAADARFEAFVTGGAYGVLGVLGLALGVVGSFLYSGTVAALPVAAVALTLINLICLWMAGRAMGTPLGAVIPAATWLLVVLLMSAKRPEGDLVIAGTLSGYVFMVGGMIAALVAVVSALTRSGGSWLLRGADPDSRVG
jgi:hypothetical protein